jgi:hypothetical protein
VINNFKKAFIFTFIISIILVITLMGAMLKEIETERNQLVIELDNLTQTNLELCDINTTLLSDNEELNLKIIKLEEENAELQKVVTSYKQKNISNNKNKSNFSCLNNSVGSAPSFSGNYGSKKTYMYYTSITNKSSAQWKIQMKATTNQYGVRVVNEDGREYVCIAIGTGWHYPVGTKVFVATTSGGFYAIIGDIKGDRATTPDHLKGTDGSITEFIVDKNLNSHAKKMGNLNVIADYSGDVTNITKVG